MIFQIVYRSNLFNRGAVSQVLTLTDLDGMNLAEGLVYILVKELVLKVRVRIEEAGSQ